MMLKYTLPVGMLIYAFGLVQAIGAAPNNGPCTEDIKRLCPNENLDKAHIVNCLKAHESELSAACKKEAKGLRDACKDDAKNFCSDIKGDLGLTYKCLKYHETKLSQDCKDQLPHMAPKETQR